MGWFASEIPPLDLLQGINVPRDIRCKDLEEGCVEEMESGMEANQFAVSTQCVFQM